MSKKINDGKTPQQRYDEKNAVMVTLKLNRKTDGDLIEWLKRQPSKQGAIKGTLRDALKIKK